jgi:hypothetical protein
MLQHIFRILIFAGFSLVAFSNSISATAIIQGSHGPNAAVIQSGVDEFRNILGALNPNTAETFPGGRREINWDGVPASFAAPNAFPANFFNSNSPRGVIFGSPTSNVSNDTGNFLVSSAAGSGTPVRFGNLDPSYTGIFQTFSAQRLFTVNSTNDKPNVLTINSFIPGTNIPATVSGFGIVFCDVDNQENAVVRVYGTDGRLLTGALSPSDSDNGLSFLGIAFNAGERIARVEIVAGNRPLKAGNIDGVNGVDVVAIDDIMYGEPRAIGYHASDFDGDGLADRTVFRPSTGNWFILNSGSNTVRIDHFGLNGDLPIEGDFDGDSRSDLAVFRPSNGAWFFAKSTDNSVFGVLFGQNGDKPVPGDYDKDGKTDIAVWRPSDGTWYTLPSGTDFNLGTFTATSFGSNGDITPQGAAQ